jgi:hypothetical protein
MNWPANGQLQVPSLLNTINKAYMLNEPSTSLAYEVSGRNIIITLPATRPNTINSVLVIAVRGLPEADESADGTQVNPTSGSFILYPSPSVDGKLYFEQENSSSLDITIYSLSGKPLLNYKMNNRSGSIDVSILPEGVYITRASDREHIYTRRFVKQH